MDTIYILNRTITQGRLAGIYSTFGILSGVLVHTTLAAFGLSVILAKSATIFSIVISLGIRYIIIDLIWCILLTIGASFFARKVINGEKTGLWMNKISGGIFILLGLKIALIKRVS